MAKKNEIAKIRYAEESKSLSALQKVLDDVKKIYVLLNVKELSPSEKVDVMLLYDDVVRGYYDGLVIFGAKGYSKHDKDKHFYERFRLVSGLRSRFVDIRKFCKKELDELNDELLHRGLVSYPLEKHLIDIAISSDADTVYISSDVVAV